MDLKEYFEENKGTSVLATADSEGKVDNAIYSRPHVINDKTVTLIMKDKLSYANLQSNPHACLLFIEKSEGYKGKRFYLTKICQEDDQEKINSLRRHKHSNLEAENAKRFLVHFRVDNVRPLVGDMQ